MIPSFRKTLLLGAALASLISVSQGFAPSPRQPISGLKISQGRKIFSALQMSSRGEDAPGSSRRQRQRRQQRESPQEEQIGDKISVPPEETTPTTSPPTKNNNNFWNDFSEQFKTLPGGSQFRMPPIQVDDPNLLFYDIFLLLNLVVSISFWVVHRLQLDYITLSFNEGCLLSILWILSGLYHGAFLDSAKDGHQRPPSSSSSMMKYDNDNTNDNNEQNWWTGQSSQSGGPPAAGLLALNTYINTISLRLLVAFAVAVVQHRPVGEDPMEQLIGYEVGFGLVLMSVWRTIHSAFTPRV